jgi:hypothetical protein
MAACMMRPLVPTVLIVASGLCCYAIAGTEIPDTIARAKRPSERDTRP